MNREISTIVIPVIGFAFASSATAKEIMPMFGGVLIDGYDMGKDIVVKRYYSTSNAVQNTATSDAPTTIQQN